MLVAELVRDISLTDHLLMRGLSALLRSNMAWRHQEIAEAGQLLLYVVLDASFQLVLRVLRERGLQNPVRVLRVALGAGDRRAREVHGDDWRAAAPRP